MQQAPDYLNALPQAGHGLLKQQTVLRLHLDLVAGSQSQHEPSLGKVVHRGCGHGDGGGAADEDAGDAGAQQDVLGPQGAGGQDRELIAPVALGHPCRFIAKLVGELDAVHDVRRRKTTREGKPDSFHENTSKPFRPHWHLAAAANHAYRSYANVQQTFHRRHDKSRFLTT